MAIAKMSATTYAELARKVPNVYDEATIGHNTTVRREPVDVLVIRYHGNAIVRLADEQTVAFRLAGWDTVTTRGRINLFLPSQMGVVTRKGVPYLLDWRRGFEVRTEVDPFGDWMVVR